MDNTQFSPELIAAYQEQLKYPNENKKEFIHIFLATFWSLSTSSILLRLYARKLTRTKFGWDDASALLAWATMTALTGVAMSCAPLSRHIVFLKKDELEKAMLSIYVAQYIYHIAISAYKAAILHYYNRIFPSKRVKTIIRVLLVLVWLHALTSLLVLPFECKPISHAWRLLTPGKCINIEAYFLSSAIIGIVLDLAIFILPLPLIWQLKLSLGKRLSIIGVFLLGAVVLISSVMRAYYIRFLVLNGDSTDPVFRNVVPATWTMAEVSTGIMCACLPSIWPLFVKVKNSALLSYRGSSASRTGQSTGGRSDKLGNSIGLRQFGSKKSATSTITSDVTASVPVKSTTTSRLDTIQQAEEEEEEEADHSHQSVMSMHTRQRQVDQAFV